MSAMMLKHCWIDFPSARPRPRVASFSLHGASSTHGRPATLRVRTDSRSAYGWSAARTPSTRCRSSLRELVTDTVALLLLCLPHLGEWADAAAAWDPVLRIVVKTLKQLRDFQARNRWPIIAAVATSLVPCGPKVSAMSGPSMRPRACHSRLGAVTRLFDWPAPEQLLSVRDGGQQCGNEIDGRGTRPRPSRVIRGRQLPGKLTISSRRSWSGRSSRRCSTTWGWIRSRRPGVGRARLSSSMSMIAGTAPAGRCAAWRRKRS